MGNEENRIIDGIRNALLDREIPYEEGRWEVFQEQYEKKIDSLDPKDNSKAVYLWKYTATAAAVVIFIIAFLYLPQTPKKEKRLTTLSQNHLTDTLKKDVIPVATPEKIKKRKSTQQPLLAKVLKSSSLSNTQLLTLNIVKNNVTMIEPRLNNIKVIKPEFPNDTSTKSKTDSYKNNNENRHFDFDVPEKAPIYSSRWKFGVELNPSLVSEHINLGVGISTQFEVSKKIKLATGLSYSSITAIHKLSPVQISSDTTMIGAHSVIKALDIPLSLIYERENGWYAAVGVSALAVLNENKTFEFESKGLQETFSTDPESGGAVSVFKVVETKFEEKSRETDFKGRNNLSYINLAIGKQYKFYSNKKILLEPFVKIPMGSLNNDNINLFNSGIKIKLLF